jgi:hypothetical protein
VEHNSTVRNILAHRHRTGSYGSSMENLHDSLTVLAWLANYGKGRQF